MTTSYLPSFGGIGGGAGSTSVGITNINYGVKGSDFDMTFNLENPDYPNPINPNKQMTRDTFFLSNISFLGFEL